MRLHCAFAGIATTRWRVAAVRSYLLTALRTLHHYLPTRTFPTTFTWLNCGSGLLAVRAPDGSAAGSGGGGWFGAVWWRTAHRCFTRVCPRFFMSNGHYSYLLPPATHPTSFALRHCTGSRFSVVCLFIGCLRFLLVLQDNRCAPREAMLALPLAATRVTHLAARWRLRWRYPEQRATVPRFLPAVRLLRWRLLLPFASRNISLLAGSCYAVGAACCSGFQLRCCSRWFAGVCSSSFPFCCCRAPYGRLRIASVPVVCLLLPPPLRHWRSTETRCWVGA